MGEFFFFWRPSSGRVRQQHGGFSFRPISMRFGILESVLSSPLHFVRFWGEFYLFSSMFIFSTLACLKKRELWLNSKLDNLGRKIQLFGAK